MNPFWHPDLGLRRCPLSLYKVKAGVDAYGIRTGLKLATQTANSQWSRCIPRFAATFDAGFRFGTPNSALKLTIGSRWSRCLGRRELKIRRGVGTV